MPKLKPEEIDEKVKEQNDEVYGEETVGGSQQGLESDDDTEKAVADVTGNQPKENEEFNIAEEIDKDEKDIAGIPPKKKNKKYPPDLQ
ncbi:MAG TPA: hypothetical protein VF185_03775 [Patescibacteria group bacterium]